MRRLAAFFLTVLLGAAGRPALAAERPNLAILAVDRLTLDALISTSPRLPRFDRLLREGALGLMTTRCVGGLAPEKIYLSIGSGQAMTAGPETSRMYDPGESFGGLTAGEAYRLGTGNDPAGAAALHLGLAYLDRLNPFAICPYGRLGEALIASGWRLAVLGNADRGGEPAREAAVVFMDRSGRVDMGRIGADTLAADWLMPGGWRTDYRLIEEEYHRLAGRADAVLMILGDVARVYSGVSSSFPSQTDVQLEAAMGRIDDFIGRIMAGHDAPERILLLVGSPPLPKVAAGDRLTPIIYWGEGIQPGLLSSDSTRQAGFVTQFDVTATIAALAGIDPAGITIGRPFICRPGTPGELQRTYAAMIRHYKQRTAVLFGFGYITFLAVLLTLALRYVVKSERPWKERVYKALTGLFLMPVLLLPLGLLPWPTWAILTALVLVSAGAGLVLPRRDGQLPAWLGMLTAGVIMVDTMAGSWLQRRSLLGYSPIFGARFYGLGNEYLGVLLGALILGGMGLVALRHRKAAIWMGIIYAAAAFVIAAPFLGANVGGGITACIGLGYAFHQLRGGKAGLRHVLLLGAGTVVFMCALVAVDLWSRGRTTHLGLALVNLHQHGWLTIGKIILDKLALNLRLLAYTGWSWVLLAVLLVVPLALKYPPGWLASYLPEQSHVRAALRAIILTAVLGLLVNDSGIVVAATTIIYLGPLLLYLPPGYGRSGTGRSVGQCS